MERRTIRLQKGEEEKERTVGNTNRAYSKIICLKIIYLKLPYLKIYFECRKESAAETYLMERSYIQVIKIDIQGAESAKRKERTALLCSAPRRPKRKGVFMCGRRDRNEQIGRAHV